VKSNVINGEGRKPKCCRKRKKLIGAALAGRGSTGGSPWSKAPNRYGVTRFLVAHGKHRGIEETERGEYVNGGIKKKTKNEKT
jgi:hypothetical protein